jgi:hypothetical protein
MMADRSAAAMCGEINGVNAHLLIAQMQPMQIGVERAESGTRLSLLLIGVFAMMARLLASVGFPGDCFAGLTASGATRFGS